MNLSLLVRQEILLQYFPHLKILSPRKLGGSWEGKVKIADDFNELNDDLIDGFYNSAIFPGKK